MQLSIIDVSPQRCMNRPLKREPGQKRQLGKAEEGWLNLQPFFDAPVTPGMVMPHGTTKPYVPQILARAEEIRQLAQTQFLELPSLAQEFKANGLDAVSLSSSENDDEAANLAAIHLKRTPFSFGTKPDGKPIDLDDLAAYQRRIEWEKYIVACGPATRIYAKAKEDGRVTLASNDRRLAPADLQPYAKKIKRLLHGRDAATLENDRERAAHYKNLVWSLMTPDQQIAWLDRARRTRAYLAPADDNVERMPFYDNDNPGEGGPAEIGLHWVVTDLDWDDPLPRSTFHDSVLHEPSEAEFWGIEDED